ncbi:MAG TPA: ABC transporter ATP-binding protein [Gemmatimonadaceae bacterium]|nr:ABC transporter ATP-binding protein [Gemmatimonadaceae bacterium]
MNTLAVATENLSRKYSDQMALDRVNLSVPEGAVYVLVGANGAGKSTTFKILLNLERPTSGTARVFGLDTGLDGPSVRAQIGYVPEQQETPYPWMTCARLLEHVRAYYPSWDQSYSAHLVESLEIRMTKKSGTLSKGEMRRLQLVMAMSHRPQLLLLDEPTEGLDPVARRQVLTLLSEHLSDSPATVVIATHHVYEVESLADYIGALNKGKLVAQMNRDELQRNVKRYQLEVTENWKAPSGLSATQLRTSSRDDEAQWTIVGDEQEVTERLNASGAQVKHSQPLTFDDAAFVLLSAETSR